MTAANLLLAVAVIVVAGAIDCRNTDNDVNEIFERAKEDAVKMGDFKSPPPCDSSDIFRGHCRS